jgi:EmrB/QacA subfamily drug resistance transporter
VAVLAVVGIGSFMSALDGSVVNIALPLIQRDFGATIPSIAWISTGYLLSISSLLLVFGRLGDMWGFRRLYAAGFVTFGIASFFCATAPSLGWLVAARTVQGVGASMLMAVAPAILTTSFPGRLRGRALGIQASVTYAGLTLGPSFGGWLAGQFGWPWVFLVNLPISATGIVFGLAVLPRTAPRPFQRFDVAGAMLFAAGLTATLIGLSRGEAWGWTGLRTIAFLAAGAGLLALFVRHQGRTEQPMMPLSLFRVPAFAGGVAAAYIQYVVVFMLAFLLPFYLVLGRGFSPEITGIIMTAQPAVMMIVAAMSGWISDRVGPRIPATLGMAMLALGTWRIAEAGPLSSAAMVVTALAIVGLGSGLFTAPNNSTIMGAARRDRQGIAAGLMAAARNVGMVSGIAIGSSLFAFHRQGLLAEGSSAEAALLGGFGATILIASAIALAGMILSLIRPVAAEDESR